MPGTPNRGTSELELDQWNQALRASPVYQAFMQRQGLPTNGRVSLSRPQQAALEQELAQNGIQIPAGMHIDQGGNLNQKNRLVRNVGIGAAATGAALTGFGLAGMGPLGGLGGAGAAGAGAGTAAGTSGAIAGGAPWALTPLAGTAAMSAPFAAGAGSAGMSIGSILSSLFKSGALGNIATVLGGATQGQANERTGQNVFNQNRDRALADLYGTEQGAALQALLGREAGAMNRYQTRQGATTHALDAQSAEGLNRARLGLEAPTARARQSVMGSLMQNLQPVGIENRNPRLAGRVPTITGGLTPAALNADTRQHGGELTKAALLAQLTGSDVPPPTDFRSGVLDAPDETDFQSGLIKPPSLTGYEGPGGLERTTGAGSFIASILEALRRQQPPGGRP